MFLKLTHSLSLATEEISSLEVISATAYSSAKTKLHIYMKNGHTHTLEHDFGDYGNDVYKLQKKLEDALLKEV